MRAGNVYVIHTALTKPEPKDKIAICVCDVDNLFFWINTQPRPHGVGQFTMVPADHSRALTHDCHLDCARMTTFPAHELRAARDRDPISSDLAARIVRYLIDHPPKTLPPRHLKLAIANLSTLIVRS